MMGNVEQKRRIITRDILDLEGVKPLVTSADISEAEEFKTEKRKCEYLTWRAVLRSALRDMGAEVSRYADTPILYRASGAPYIEGLPLWFGVSHSRDMVAVVISDERCAVDIETRDRRFEAIESRYLSAEELAILEGAFGADLGVGRAVAWSAKEAAYKYCQTEGLDFVRDMQIVGVDELRAEITVTAQNRRLKLSYEVHEKYVVVAV
ncbi:MAG: 4'-phosphopantetheinyl transferase superfamily protein [Rikenellaceae bacterium]